MNAGRTIAYLMLILLVSMACVMCVLCGVLAGGIAGFMTGGAVGMAGGSGLDLPSQRWRQVTPLPFLPNPQVVPQAPWSQATPQAPVPQRTPQARQTPQTQRTPPAPGQTLPVDPAQIGALVEAVEPGSPAEKAGIQVNDLITAVNGAPVDANHALADLIRANKPGDKVTLSILRKGAARSIDVTLGTRRLDTGQDVASLGVTYTQVTPSGPTN
jgi:S1-C subfamily serine protease